MWFFLVLFVGLVLCPHAYLVFEVCFVSVLILF